MGKVGSDVGGEVGVCFVLFGWVERFQGDFVSPALGVTGGGNRRVVSGFGW